MFRVGGYYRDGYGDVCRIVSSDADGRAVVQGKPARDRPWGGYYEGRFLLATGESANAAGRRDRVHLLPGELHQVAGEWVPVAEPGKSVEEAALSDALWEALSAPDAAMIERDGKWPFVKRTRPPLTWAAKTPFQPFADFGVGVGTNDAMPALQGPLQRISDTSGILTDPAHGLAAVRGG